MQARFQITAVSRDVAPQVIDLPQHSEPCVSSSLSITDSAATVRACVCVYWQFVNDSIVLGGRTSFAHKHMLMIHCMYSLSPQSVEVRIQICVLKNAAGPNSVILKIVHFRIYRVIQNSVYQRILNIQSSEIFTILK